MSALPILMPCRLSVESERPCTMTLPWSVMVIQSPCRQTPGNISKYALRYRDPSGSFQNATGIDGIGLVMTSSPTSPRTGSPDSSHASIATPRYGADSSPGHTGTVRTPPMKADTTSVPPLIDATWTRSPTLSRNHNDDDAGSDEPVMPTVLSADRSYAVRGTAPAFAQPST